MRSVKSNIMIKDLEYFKKNKNNFLNNRKLFNSLLNNYFRNLTNYHYNRCKEYNKICKNLCYKIKNSLKIDSLPFLPATIFKSLNLRSVPKEQVVRVMRSSGTTNNGFSKIYLDKNNARNQIQALNELFFEATATKERLPMLVIDRKTILNDKENFSARSAAIIGFSLFAKNITYALNDDMSLNYEVIRNFIKKNKDTKNIIFGFTFLIWEKLIKTLNAKDLELKKSIVIHGGGWKKLKKEKISNKRFKDLLLKKFKIDSVINYYGMVEQTGSIFFESKCGYFHTSIFSDIYIRDKYFRNIGFKKKGMIQLLSVLPTSYPGHNILTEDTGIIYGEDDCTCGKKGKYFKVFDRLEKSELRGCSDVISK